MNWVSNITGKYLSLLAAVLFSVLSAAHVARGAESAGLSVVYGLTLADICGAGSGEAGAQGGECPNCDLAAVGTLPTADNCAIPLRFQSGGLSFAPHPYTGHTWRWQLAPARAPPGIA